MTFAPATIAPWSIPHTNRITNFSHGLNTIPFPNPKPKPDITPYRNPNPNPTS